MKSQSKIQVKGHRNENVFLAFITISALIFATSPLVYRHQQKTASAPSHFNAAKAPVLMHK